jgi:putative addiction module component (TIGR02574 family)
MSKVQELYEQAMKLKKKDRLELAERLWDAIISQPPGEEISQEEWEREWGEEIARRVERLERGETKAIPWDEALARMRKKLRNMKRSPAGRKPTATRSSLL